MAKEIIAYSLQEFLDSPNDYNALDLSNQNITDEDCSKLAVVLSDAIQNSHQINDILKSLNIGTLI